MPQDGQAPNGRPRQPNEPSAWEWSWRRALAAALLAVVVLMTGISELTPHLRVEEPAANNPAVTVRRPLGPFDASVLAAVILAAALMLPDVKRFRFGPAEFEKDPGYTLGPEDDVKADEQQLVPKADAFVEALRALGGQDDPPPTEQEGEQ